MTWPSGSVTLEVPAHEDFVAAIRGMTRSLAVLGDLAVDDVEELQMAIDEAATLLLPIVDPDHDGGLRTTFDVAPGTLRLTLTACCRPGETVDRDGLAWMMLTALDPGAAVTVQGPEISIAVGRSRSADLS
jgi:serine/threonine-protein kinase RsbW